jgi:hypothetical protein
LFPNRWFQYLTAAAGFRSTTYSFAKKSSICGNTIAGVNYRLRYTNAAGLTSPISTWSTGGSIASTGSVLTLQDTHADPIRFYAVEAQP